MSRSTSQSQLVEEAKMAQRFKELRCAYACIPTSCFNIQILFTVSRDCAANMNNVFTYITKAEFSDKVRKAFLHEIEVCERDPLNYTPLERRKDPEEDVEEVEEE